MGPGFESLKVHTRGTSLAGKIPVTRNPELVRLTQRVHLFPFRTQKLSSVVPTILGWRRPGKIGIRQHETTEVRPEVLTSRSFLDSSAVPTKTGKKRKFPPEQQRYTSEFAKQVHSVYQLIRRCGIPHINAVLHGSDR